jgi:hypothetical protein
MRRTGLAIGSLGAAGLVMAAAAAQGTGGGVVNTAYLIIDAGDPDASAQISAFGDENSVAITVVCTGPPPDDDTVTITAATNHPDKVAFRPKRGSIAQKRRDNKASLTIEGTSANWPAPVIFDCDTQTVDGRVIDKQMTGTGKGRFSAKGSKCGAPLTQAQAGEVLDFCETEVLKARIDPSTGEVRSLRIRGDGSTPSLE